MIAKSKSGPRRAAVLILVHVLIAGHIAWWWWRGDVLTPVEPSESMQTLETGLVNAGAVFFASALLLQLIFGRFMCGWACHVVAMQDLCAWMLEKVGIRPKVWRSRVLMWAPLVLAIHMFVWPTVRRLMLPWIVTWWPGAPDWIGRAAPFSETGFRSHFVTTGFWDTFPSIAVAIPFALVCGFLIVYLLGAKGFCTYGCPYGGFFTPLDRLSPGRILANLDACEGCGHCTAVCTSNVRVHEEIQVYGGVVDPGCMKCLDCVSVCPKDALRYGFAAPSLLVGKKERARKKVRVRRVYDLTLGEEISFSLVFLGSFLALRGAYEVFPTLFAIGSAACVTFLVWKAWRMARRDARDVRAVGLQLKRAGRVRSGGWIFGVLVLAMVVLVAHTGLVNWHRRRGDAVFESLAVSKDAAIAANTPGSGAAAIDESVKARAQEALDHYRSAAPISDGGLGLVRQVAVELRSALLLLVAGDAAGAEAALLRVEAMQGEQDELSADIARVMLAQGKTAEEQTFTEGVLTRHPEFWALREMRAARMMGEGKTEAVLADARAALTAIEDSWQTRTARARTHLTAAWALGVMDKTDEALEELRLAAAADPKLASARAGYAMGLATIKHDVTAAAAEMRAAADLEPGDAPRWFTLGQMYLDVGKKAEAVEAFRRAAMVERVSPRREQLRQSVYAILKESGMVVEAEAWKREFGW